MRQTREFVVKALYQWLISEDCIDALILRSDNTLKPERCKKAIIRSIALYPEAVSMITPLLSDQQWGRLHLTEQAILIQVYYELAECWDVPYRVIINEAVELAKLYGGDESFRLINRLADRMAPMIRPVEVEVGLANRQMKTKLDENEV